MVCKWTAEASPSTQETEHPGTSHIREASGLARPPRSYLQANPALVDCILSVSLRRWALQLNKIATMVSSSLIA